MILYLGLDPSRFVSSKKALIHYPVIRIEPRQDALCFDSKEVTHLIFTSRSSSSLWKVFEGKEVFAIGEPTAEVLRQKGVNPYIAPFATQEGMIELLKKHDLRGAYVVWPRSLQARDLLSIYLKNLGKQTRIEILDLYETCYQKLEPVPSLEAIEEIVFTSPSTVEGFFQIFGFFPKDKKLTCIGPITQKKLSECIAENFFAKKEGFAQNKAHR